MSAKRGGPLAMDGDDALALFDQPRWASVCVEVGDSLVTTPARVQRAGAVLEVAPVAGSSLPESECRACVVADDFETYVGIRGAIVRGVLSPVGAGARTLRITKHHGFSFENTTVSL